MIYKPSADPHSAKECCNTGDYLAEYIAEKQDWRFIMNQKCLYAKTGVGGVAANHAG